MEVEKAGDDIIGQRVFYMVKKIIQRSEGLRLTNVEKKRLIIHLNSVDLELFNISGLSSAIAVTYTFLQSDENIEIYLENYIYVCELQTIKETAEDIVADADDIADRYIR